MPAIHFDQRCEVDETDMLPDAALMGQRCLHQTPVGVVLSVYLDEIVPCQAVPAKVAVRVDHLLDW